MASETNSTVLACWSEDALRIFQKIREAHQRLLQLNQFELANDVTYLLSYGTGNDLYGTCLTLDQLNEIYETLVQFSTFLGTHNANTNLTPIEIIYRKY